MQSYVASNVAMSVAEPDAAGGAPAVPTLDHLILNGQSLSLGTDPVNNSSVLSTTPSGTHKMFNGGVRVHYDEPALANVNTALLPTRMGSLTALVEQDNPNNLTDGETVAYGISLGLTNETLFSATGRGAYKVIDLSLNPGSDVATYHFSNTVATALRAKILAEAQGKAYRLLPMLWKQGEADGAANTSAATWKSQLRTLLADYRYYLTAATGQDCSGLKMVVDQLAVRWDGAFTYAQIAMAAFELWRDYPDEFILAGPTYPELYAAINDVHFTSVGYRVYGERLGRVYANHATWKPCYITGVSRSGTTVTVNVWVPEGALVNDLSGSVVATVTNSGFAYSGANITAVNITDTGAGDNAGVIQLTLDAAVGGTLTYAYNNGLNQRMGTPFGPRGTIRDSATAVTAYDGRPLYNWLCSYSGAVA